MHVSKLSVPSFSAKKRISARLCSTAMVSARAEKGRTPGTPLGGNLNLGPKLALTLAHRNDDIAGK